MEGRGKTPKTFIRDCVASLGLIMSLVSGFVNSSWYFLRKSCNVRLILLWRFIIKVSSEGVVPIVERSNFRTKCLLHHFVGFLPMWRGPKRSTKYGAGHSVCHRRGRACLGRWTSRTDVAGGIYTCNCRRPPDVQCTWSYQQRLLLHLCCGNRKNSSCYEEVVSFSGGRLKLT